jgi:protocatechuate 3,4-dioxygenase beta subunit
VKPIWWIACALAAAACATAAGASARDAANCAATPPDAFGPFGRGMPPARAKIGTGHVLTGVVLSTVNCAPLRRAAVQLWQSNRNGVYTRAGSATVFTGRDGRFRFEGPFPASYEGRPPHIHIRVVARDHVTLLARYEPARGERRGTIRLVLRPVEL